MPRLHIMNNLRVLFFSLLLTAPVHASLFDHPVQSVDESPKLLEVMESLADASRVRSQFRQTKKMEILRRPLISEGVMIYQRELGLYWHIETPFPSTMVITSERITQRTDHQLTEITASKNPVIFGFSQVFFQLLSGDIDQLSKRFELYFDKTVATDNTVWSIGLIPLNKQLRGVLKTIVLRGEVVNQNSNLQKIMISDHAGDLTVIEFMQRQVGGLELSEQERKQFAL